MLYNVCLTYSEGEKVQAAEATLWFRHLLPFVPQDHVSSVINDLDRQLPMLKNGVFWLHNALASQIVLNPFQIFIKDLVRISYSILELERVLPTIKSPPINVNDLDEDDKVVHQSPDGQLKVGFSEEAEQQQDGLQVWLRENPFDRMPGTSDRYITRQRGSINTVVPFRKLLLCAEDAKVQNVDEAILTLKRLADS